MNIIKSATRAKFWSIVALLLTISPLFASAATYSRPVLQTPTAKCVNGLPQISLDWASVSGANSYSVFRLNKSTNIWTNVSSKKFPSEFTDMGAKSGASYQYQVKAYFGSNSRYSYSNIVSAQPPSCASVIPPPAPAPAPTPIPPAPASSSEIRFNAYLTGYGWPDNTPASANISHGFIHTQAGGIGTFADPITIAVGHSIVNGIDILDYPKGTKFYIPTLRKYFIVEDTCGDGSTPQNGPCHTGHNGLPWLDAWVGGQNATASSVYSCENKITGEHAVIQNPASNYLVVPGAIFTTTCATLFGNTAVTV